MGKLTTEVFNESCCDGGAVGNSISCQPCGCDEGAGWLCSMHRDMENDKLRHPDITAENGGPILITRLLAPNVVVPMDQQIAVKPIVNVTVDEYKAMYGGRSTGMSLTVLRKEKKLSKIKRHFKEVIAPTWNFSGRLLTPEDHQKNAMIGLASEAGETLDIGKKMWYHTEKENGFYREKLVSELGDVLYYFLKTLDVFGITLKEVLKVNREKLESRHPELGQVTERFGKDFIK